MHDLACLTRTTPVLTGWGDACVGQLHVSDTSLSAAELAIYQRRSMEGDLCELVWRCRDKYRYAVQLLQPCADLSQLDVSRSELGLTTLYLLWDKLCFVYRCHAFDAQCDLFEAQEVREKDRWRAYCKRCFATVLNEPSYTRCILEHTGLLSTPEDQRTTCLDALFAQLSADIIDRNRSI